jgi:hypothetical protein
VLLSINEHAGHGMGSSLSIRAGQMADIEAFLFDQLGMKLPPERSASAASAAPNSSTAQPVAATSR